MSSSIAWAPSFSVNSTIKGGQYSPKIHALKDGSFVAVWADYSESGTDMDRGAIRGQLFNADGSKKGSEFLINTTTVGEQRAPDVTVLNDGRFVVVWEDGPSGFVMGRAYNANGSAIGNEFQVSSTGYDTDISIAALTNGGFAVSYWDEDSKTRIQSFDASLQKSVDEAVIEASGGVTATVGLQGQYITFFDPDDTIRGVIRNNDGSAPAGAATFDVSTTGDENSAPVAARLADGRIIVIWSSETYRTGSDLTEIKGQILNADGTKSGGELLLSASESVYPTHAVVTALADGAFALSYMDTPEGRNSVDIHFSTFNGSGVRVGADTILGRTYVNDNSSLDIATMADGRLAITWQSFASEWDDFGYSILGQIVDLRQSGVNLTGSAADDQHYGSRFNDVLKGDAGNDMLSGREGNDTLDGGTGADQMQGGAGNDTYYVDNAGDRTVEEAGGGMDHVLTAVTQTLQDGVENLTATGSFAAALSGNGLANVITGNAANNTIQGGGGNDTLSGAAGRDIFVFNLKADKATNLDTVTDFSAKDDSIWLDNAVFKKLGKGTELKPGKLNKAFFVAGSKAKDKNDYVLYDKKKGTLYYDADGSGKTKAVEIANLSKNLKGLSSLDFFVI